MKLATRAVFVAVIFSALLLPCSLTEAARINRLRMGRSSVEDYLLQCWAEFVSSMSTGIPESNIPAFDPWVSVDHFPFRMQDSNMALRADVNATDVESLGFSSVQISSIQENANSLYNVSLNLPDLDISGIYSLVGSHHYFYPIVGYGPFRLTLRNVWSTGITTLLFDGTVYSLTKLELTPLSYGSAASEYFNLSISGAESNSETFIRFTNLLTESLWYQVEEELRMELSDSITKYLNEQLLDFHPSSSALLAKKLKKIKHF